MKTIEFEDSTTPHHGEPLAGTVKPSWQPYGDENEYLIEDYEREAEAMKEMINELRNENKALRIERDTFKTCLQIMSNSKRK